MWLCLGLSVCVCCLTITVFSSLCASEVKLSLASFLSDRIVDEILEALSTSQLTLVRIFTVLVHVRPLNCINLQLDSSSFGGITVFICVNLKCIFHRSNFLSFQLSFLCLLFFQLSYPYLRIISASCFLSCLIHSGRPSCAARSPPSAAGVGGSGRSRGEDS